MSTPVAGPALPYAFCESQTSTNQSGSSTLATFTTLDFATDNETLLNGLIDRPTTSRFRALARGYYRMHYALNGRSGTNNRAVQYRVIRNGSTVVLGTSTIVTAQNNDNRAGSGTATRIIELQINDYLEVQQANTEAGVTPTTIAGSKVLFELVRLL